MKKIFYILAMLLVFSINSINAQITETVYDTTNVTITNVNMFPNDSTTTYIGYDSAYTYEVGVTFRNDSTTDSLTITLSIKNGYIYSIEDSAFVCKIATEDNVPATLTLDTTNNCMYINFKYGTVDTIGEYCDTLLVTTYIVDIIYTIPDPTAVENTVITSPYNVWNENNTIVLNGAEGEMVAIYNVNGRLVSYKLATSDTMRYTLNSGVYFIKVGKNVMKAIVR